MTIDFIGSALKGFSAKLIVEAIFRDSNYEAYPFGYESTFSRLIRNIDIKDKTQTQLQLRCMPDLLIFDPKNRDISLVECKYRKVPKLNNVRLSKTSLERYKKYWVGSILVVIVPMGELLYAQYVERLDTNLRVTGDNIYYDLEKDFEPFTSIFQNVKKETILKYKTFIETISDRED